MKIRMMKTGLKLGLKTICGGVVLLTALFFLTGFSEAASRSKVRYYNKNALPYGWQYEAGYTLWRTEKGLAVNPNTYKKYRNDKAWRRNLYKGGIRPDAIILDGLDWTAEEIAKFWNQYNEYFKFHPAGVDYE